MWVLGKSRKASCGIFVPVFFIDLSLVILNGCCAMFQLAYQEVSQKQSRSLMLLLPKKMAE